MVDRDTLNQIIALLEPVLADFEARKGQFDLLFYGAPSRPDVDLSGPPREAITRLVMALDAYGKLESGQYALAALLDQMRNLFGVDKQKQIDDLIKRIQEAGQAAPVHMGAMRLGAAPIAPPDAAKLPKTVKAQRRLEAAMPAETAPRAKTEVRVKVSLPESDGLAAELPVKARSGQLIEKQDVAPASFVFEFKRNKAGELMPGVVCVEVESDEFTVSTRAVERGDCAEGLTELEIPPEADSRTLIIYLTAKADAPPGLAYVRVSLHYKGRVIAQTAVNTTLTGAQADQGQGIWALQQMILQLQTQVIGGVSPAVGPAPLPPQTLPGGKLMEPQAPLLDDILAKPTPITSTPKPRRETESAPVEWAKLPPREQEQSRGDYPTRQPMLPPAQAAGNSRRGSPITALIAGMVVILAVGLLLTSGAVLLLTSRDAVTPTQIVVTRLAPTNTPTPTPTPTPTATATATPAK